MSRLSASLLLLLTAFIWGTGFVAQKLPFLPGETGESLGPLGFTGVRFLLGTLVVLPLALREARRAARPLTRTELQGFALCGLALFAGAYLQQIGIIGTSVTNSGFLTSLYVALVPLVTLMLFGTPTHWVVWPAAAGCVAGTWLLGGGRLDEFTIGDAWVALSAIFWALQVTLVGTLAARTGRPLTLATVQFACCAAAALAVAAPLEPLNAGAVLAGGSALLYSGVLSVGVAFTLQVIGQRYTHPAAAAVIMSSEAVFAALAGALLLGERLGLLGVAGAALILVSLLSVELAPLLWRRPGQGATMGISQRTNSD